MLHRNSIHSMALICEEATFTQNVCDGAVARATELGMLITARVDVSELNSSDISVALQRIRTPAPDAVIGATYYSVSRVFFSISRLQALLTVLFFIYVSLSLFILESPPKKTQTTVLLTEFVGKTLLAAGSPPFPFVHVGACACRFAKSFSRKWPGQSSMFAHCFSQLA